MAFISTKSNIKNSILAFIRHLVSKPVYKAIEIILTPCCHPVITSVEATCLDGNTILTIELASKINLYGSATAFISIPDLGLRLSVPYQDNGIIVTDPFLNVLGPGNYSIFIELFMPTSSNDLVGVSLLSESFTVSFPNCAPL